MEKSHMSRNEQKKFFYIGIISFWIGTACLYLGFDVYENIRGDPPGAIYFIIIGLILTCIGIFLIVKNGIKVFFDPKYSS